MPKKPNLHTNSLNKLLVWHSTEQILIETPKIVYIFKTANAT
jgi:hypothetical protein